MVEMNHKLLTHLKAYNYLFTKLYPAKISNTFTVHPSFDLIKHAAEVAHVHFKVYQKEEIKN